MSDDVTAALREKARAWLASHAFATINADSLAALLVATGAEAAAREREACSLVAQTEAEGWLRIAPDNTSNVIRANEGKIIAQLIRARTDPPSPAGEPAPERETMLVVTVEFSLREAEAYLSGAASVLDDRARKKIRDAIYDADKARRTGAQT